MNSILKKIVDHKLEEIERAKERIAFDELAERAKNAPPVRDFAAALRKPGVRLIAEVKKASPSAGVIREDFDPVRIARAYESAGAACISVLTDEHFFQGHLDFLVQVRSGVGIPVLRKDFVLDEYQVVEARVAGADAVLLIAECLEGEQLQRLHQTIVAQGMTPLVEFYDADNCNSVLACNPVLVGVNNRNLNTFQTDISHSIRLRDRVPGDIVFVSESGIDTHDDVKRLQDADVDAMLVGESLMRAEHIEEAVRRLLGN